MHIPVDFLTWLFTGKNQSGRLVYYAMDTEHVYHVVRWEDMINEGIYQDLSSAVLWPPGQTEGAISSGCTILFERSGPLDFNDFNGPFMQMTIREDADNSYPVDDFGEYGFDNTAKAMLLIKTPLESERCVPQYFSFRDLFLAKWTEKIDEMLQKAAQENEDIQEIIRLGEPILYWTVFPQEGDPYSSGLSSEEIYLGFRQRLYLDIDNWPDYQAEIFYWIQLYIDADNKHIRGYVAKMAKWVEDGSIYEEIANGINDAMLAGMDEMNEALRNELEEMLNNEIERWGITNYTLKRLYYLPGRQLERPQSGVITDSAGYDTTIVIEITDIEIGEQPWPEFERVLFTQRDKNLLDWIYKKRSEYAQKHFGKQIIEWYRNLKAAGLYKVILDDKESRDISMRIIKNGDRLFSSAKEMFSTSDLEDSKLLLNKLKKITKRKDMPTLEKVKSFSEILVGKTLYEIEKELDKIMNSEK